MPTAFDLDRLPELYGSYAPRTPAHGQECDPYGAPHRDLMPFLNAAQRTGFCTPFDWNAWLATQPQGFSTDAGQLPGADLETLRKLLTAHTRLDRFMSGHLEHLHASGYLDAFVQRLRVLQGAAAGTHQPPTAEDAP